MLNFATRIDAFIEMIKAKADERLKAGIISQKDLDKMDIGNNITFEELAAFQTAKNLAMMNGKISQEEAQQIYMILGETPEHFNERHWAEKATVTKIMAELMK